MGRPRSKSAGLPKYVSVINGAYWWRGPGVKPHRIAAVGDFAALYKFLATAAPAVEAPVERQTMADFLDRYEREVVPTLAPRTQDDYRRYLEILKRWIGALKPDDLKPRDVGRFLTIENPDPALRIKGKVARNRCIAVLSAVYGKMIGRWYVCEVNPCQKVERNPTSPRRRYVTDAEYAAVYGYMDSKVQVAMDLALLTGQRQGDLLALKWDAVSTEGVRFEQSKTGKRLMVEMSPALEAVLNRARKFLPHLPREYVLRARRTGAPYTSQGFRAKWQAGMRKALRAGVIGERFTFHDIRAKSASDSESVNAAYERLGHTSMSMTRQVYDRGTRKVKPLK